MTEQTKVTFIYDEKSEKWDVEVSGLTDPIEVKQAFNAVVLTCRDEAVIVGLEHQVQLFFTLPDTWRLIPAVDAELRNT